MSKLLEVLELGAADSLLFCQAFFPNAFRQPPAPFHKELWDVLEDRAHRYVAISVFRGGAKTTILRAFTAKRIAYGISRTVLFVSASQEHSKKSLEWLRVQVEQNKTFAQAFGLSIGRKWTDEQIQVKNNVLGITSSVLALGITGQTRGINVGDYRPDLIVVDDPLTEETVATPEQREKTAQLFFGALARSLTPQTECPDAKMVLLQTVMHQEDLVSTCFNDPLWATRSYSCFTPDGESSWPERFPKEQLMKEKDAHIQRGQLSLWLREMECRVVAPEASIFKGEWLRYWEVLPEGMVTFIGVDPVPPPKESGVPRGDFESIAVVGVRGSEFYLLDYRTNRGHTPEWTINTLFELVDRWRPLKVAVEGVAYQRTLKWLIEQEMRKRGRFFQVDAAADMRKKLHRVAQALSGIASQGRFFIHRNHREFYEQFISFPTCVHDDVIDSVAMAIRAATEFEVPYFPQPEPLPQWRYAP